MRNTLLNRRKFLLAATTAAAVPFLAAEVDLASSPPTAAAESFLKNWGEAWNSHDAHALSFLHTSDAVTVNRFGTLVQGRVALEKALGFLHGVNGPFHDAVLPPLQLIDVRQIASNVLILQASWKSPVMNPDGKLDMAKQDDMIVSYTLVQDGIRWMATQVDLHNVEAMNLPFSNAGQKP